MEGSLSLSLSSPLPPRHEIVSAPNDIYCPPCHQLPLLFVGSLQARAFGRGTPLGCRRWGEVCTGAGAKFSLKLRTREGDGIIRIGKQFEVGRFIFSESDVG